MKTMTCKQLGGPCDHQHQGQTADEVIKAQDRHLKEMVAGGDTAHELALTEMKGRWKHPIRGMGWYRAAKRTSPHSPRTKPRAIFCRSAADHRAPNARTERRQKSIARRALSALLARR